MATVYVGSARIDENGKAYGGKAGDQTGKELSTQKWYKHNKGWRVLRCTDPEKAKQIAKAMTSACANSRIGYDQYQRLTLYEAAKTVGFDPAKVTVACETDCSALVCVCLAYAGITVGNFRTTTQAAMMLATGMFVELSGTKYTGQSAYLRTGDVLVTRTQGHTVVVLNDGDKAEMDVPPGKVYMPGDRVLRRGCVGSDVVELQKALLSHGFKLPLYGADGDYGQETESALIAFQKKVGIPQSGVYDSESHKALMDALHGAEDEQGQGQPDKVETVAPLVQIVCENGNVNIRTGNGTQYGKIAIVKDGETYPFVATAANGWHAIVINGQVGWVSGKYAKVG